MKKIKNFSVLKIEDDLKSEGNLKNEDDFKIEGKISMSVTNFSQFRYRYNNISIQLFFQFSVNVDKAIPIIKASV